MARVVVIIEDRADSDAVSVEMKSEPPFDPALDVTPAQHVAAIVAQAIRDYAEDSMPEAEA